MIKESITKVIEGISLSAEETADTFRIIMSGEATDAQIAAFIIALRMKGETAAEIEGAAKVMQEFATPIKVSHDVVLDTCGTGGDSCGTFNISTTAAFVAAGGGVAVAKHGNRSVSSKSGSADALEALGINIDIDAKKVEECIEKCGIGFLFAPKLHGAMKHAIGPRKEIAVRTIFNILGPLTNPARANVQLLGVFNKKLPPLMVDVLKSMGSKRVLVVAGEDGLDEITLCEKTNVSELRDGKITSYQISPSDFGLEACSLLEIKGGDSQENAKITEGILKGEITGPKRDIVLLNSAAALYVSGKAESISEGVLLAAKIIDDGLAYNVLEKLRQISNS